LRPPHLQRRRRGQQHHGRDGRAGAGAAGGEAV